ncbi:MAG: isochorismatase family protein [Planctomycetota bacterium]
MSYQVSADRLDAIRSAVLVIDVQQKLLPAIPSGEIVVYVTERLLKAAELVGVPRAATVQYPKGLGPLDPSLAKALPAPEEKLEFSAAVCRTELERWRADGRNQIVVCGIETHICVLQTALDLIAEGLAVHVVAEAVAARGGQEHELAMEQMRSAGATITSFESVVFQWLGSASHPAFKSISRMVKDG